MFGHVDECPRCGAKDVYMEELTDARGIYCGSACEKCMPAFRKQYRPDVLTDANYESCEPIDEEY